MSEEQLVLDGRKLKILCAKRQSAAAEQSGIIIDTLRFTVPQRLLFEKEGLVDDFESGSFEPHQIAHYFANVFAQLLGFSLGERRNGREFYESSWTIKNASDCEMGSVSAGGAGQRGTILFSLKGQGCTWARAGWERAVHDYFEHCAPKITRIDMARDFFDGEVSIEDVVAQYRNHEFSYRKRLPSYEMHGAWALGHTIDGASLAGHSRTFQVGKRESGKLMRAYEKGHAFGIMESCWLRCEVELRSENKRLIPWDAVVEPAAYYAGAYAATHSLCGHALRKIVATGQQIAQASAQRAMDWLERTVAPILVQVNQAMSGDTQWLQGIARNNRQRPVPRSLRGLKPEAMFEGLRHALDKFMHPQARRWQPA